MDLHCKHCDEANMDFVNDCEYSCDNPCEQAKDFYKRLGNKIDGLIEKCRQLLRKEDEGK